MNIRKNIDYSEMYEQLDLLMAKEQPQMDLYCGIGKAVCRRTEKGAAVMASEYLNKQYPDVKGFSPRSLRRMRDFYRTYENRPALLSRAMRLGWIQNVVIMEAELTMELREWYMKAAKQFGWSKMQLIENIANEAHQEMVLDIGQNLCENINYSTNAEEERNKNKLRIQYIYDLKIAGICGFQSIRKIFLMFRCRDKPIKDMGYMTFFFFKTSFAYWKDIRKYHTRNFQEAL